MSVMVRGSDGVAYHPVGFRVSLPALDALEEEADATGESRAALLERLVVERLRELGHDVGLLPQPAVGKRQQRGYLR